MKSSRLKQLGDETNNIVVQEEDPNGFSIVHALSKLDKKKGVGGLDKLNFLNIQARKIRGGLAFDWIVEGVGNGEISFIVGKDGQLVVDSECMSPEFCAAVIKGAIIKHNEEMAEWD